jgi:glycosyltransferase involved in cell wall biosynthesis
VNSRYAAVPLAARIPYALWEATTVDDEMHATSAAAWRRAGLGSGVGALVHASLLPMDAWLERLTYRRAAALFAMSPHTRVNMTRVHGIPIDRISCLPHPPTPAYMETLRRMQPHHRPSDDARVRLLFVGRVDDPRKNFQLLREAHRRVRDRGVSACLTVIGAHSARWRANLAMDEQRDEVCFLGGVSLQELASAYLSHDLLVVSSRQEGFGIVVAEAMHAGMPVLATRCGGPEDIIASSGGGVLADHDAAAFAASLERLARNAAERRSMGAKGRAWADRELSFDAFADRVAGITRDLVAGAAPP